MSLEQQVAILSQRVGELIHRVTTQADKWDAIVNAKKQEVDSFITNSKNLFKSNEIRQFKVLGDGNTFYPIVFTFPARYPVELQIFRQAVHYDVIWHGSMFFEVHYFSDNWGNGSSYLRLVKHLFFQKHFVARYTHEWRGNSIIVWLRGQTTYDYISSYYDVSINYEPTTKVFDYGEYGQSVYTPLTAVDTELQTQYFGYGR